MHIELQEPNTDTQETIQLQEAIVLPLETITTNADAENSADA